MTNDQYAFLTCGVFYLFAASYQALRLYFERHDRNHVAAVLRRYIRRSGGLA